MMSGSAPAPSDSSRRYAKHTTCGQSVQLERRAIAGSDAANARVEKSEMVIICRRCGVVPADELDTAGPFCAVLL